MEKNLRFRTFRKRQKREHNEYLLAERARAHGALGRVVALVLAAGAVRRAQIARAPKCGKRRKRPHAMEKFIDFSFFFGKRQIAHAPECWKRKNGPHAMEKFHNFVLINDRIVRTQLVNVGDASLNRKTLDFSFCSKRQNCPHATHLPPSPFTTFMFW